MTLNSPLKGLKMPAEESDSLRLQDGSLVRHCQRVYKLEMQRLKWRHWNGEGGSAVAVGRSALIDRIIEAGLNPLSRNFQLQVDSLPAHCEIPLGHWENTGAGIVHSPVDVLLLGKSHATSEEGNTLENSVGTVLKSLGFEVRITVLTAKECLHRAQSQFPFAFGCLRARRVSGDLSLFQEWNQRFWMNLVKNQMTFLSEMADYLHALHEDYGPTVYLTESDLNLGAGGLVDLAGLHGCLKVMTGNDDPVMRPSGGSLSPRDWNRLQDARRQLILVRNHLTFWKEAGKTAC
jgi:hypothetical protein